MTTAALIAGGVVVVLAVIALMIGLARRAERARAAAQRIEDAYEAQHRANEELARPRSRDDTVDRLREGGF